MQLNIDFIEKRHHKIVLERKKIKQKILPHFHFAKHSTKYAKLIQQNNNNLERERELRFARWSEHIPIQLVTFRRRFKPFALLSTIFVR